ncbi:hypothetical protein [Sorangium sp. So ce117]|uniref:hypothetical protein n=1 Tax=Sorangium sp. So ce117 TaxID=3133277 RepID=UPI003F60592C
MPSPTEVGGSPSPLSWDAAPPEGAQTAFEKGQSVVVPSSTPFVVRSQDDELPFYVAACMTGSRAFQLIGDPEFIGVVAAE